VIDVGRLGGGDDAASVGLKDGGVDTGSDRASGMISAMMLVTPVMSEYSST